MTNDTMKIYIDGQWITANKSVINSAIKVSNNAQDVISRIEEYKDNKKEKITDDYEETIELYKEERKGANLQKTKELATYLIRCLIDQDLEWVLNEYDKGQDFYEKIFALLHNILFMNDVRGAEYSTTDEENSDLQELCSILENENFHFVCEAIEDLSTFRF